MQDTTQLLKALTSCPGVSGAEENITDLLKNILSDYGDVSVDSHNNVKCTFGNGRRFLLDAHLDEIGMIVKSITPDGFIKVDKCGGIDNRMLLAAEVSIWGKDEIKGVISTLPPHLQKKGDDSIVPKIDDIAIDAGLSQSEAKRLISPGDRVTFKRNFTKLLGNRISSSALDDRSGVAAILLAVQKLKDINAAVTVLFSSQEELGLRGAKTAVYGEDIDEAIVVDVSFGYSPMCKKTDCGEIDGGPMIGISPVLSKEMSRDLQTIAENNSIPFQTEVMGSGHTGTNADVISVSQSGIKTALISIPERYMHSPVEVVSTADVENTAKLIYEYISYKAGVGNA